MSSTMAASMYGVAANSTGGFVAVGYGTGGAGVYATSTDGTTWTAPVGFVGSARMFNGCAKPDGSYILVGRTAANQAAATYSTV